MKSVRAGASNTYKVIAQCPPSHGDWVECRGVFTTTEDQTSGDVSRIEVYFTTSTESGSGLVDVPYDLDDLSLTRQNGPAMGIVVPSSVVGKWGVGSEIVITSHTRQWDADQVRTINSILPYTGQRGYMVLGLDSSFVRPTTERESPEFATEVALLSRNIQFEGAGYDESRGGHFIVMRTPAAQTIEGVAFRRFGQQGTLGRYPVHFHLCGDANGSKVSKSLIRESHQRGIVVHGSNGVTVEDNVAHDVFGHCFMLEDGFETSNTFARNLGARIKNMPTENLIPDNGQNGEETDNKASVFWMTNVSAKHALVYCGALIGDCC